MIGWLRRVWFDGRLFLCNRIVAAIPSHGIRRLFYRTVMKAKIGKGSTIFMGAWFDNIGNLKIGRNSVVNQNVRLDNRGGITIGDNVSISADAVILTADHDLQSPDFAGRNRSVTIEDYVFVGTRAMVLPGVRLGRGSAVAAGAVVTKDVAPLAIVAGVPAKVIGSRPEPGNYECEYERLFF